jgi:hypothetical protein
VQLPRSDCTRGSASSLGSPLHHRVRTVKVKNGNYPFWARSHCRNGANRGVCGKLTINGSEKGYQFAGRPHSRRAPSIPGMKNRRPVARPPVSLVSRHLVAILPLRLERNDASPAIFAAIRVSWPGVSDAYGMIPTQKSAPNGLSTHSIPAQHGPSLGPHVSPNPLHS